MKNLWEFYLKYWLPLGELLTEMEREGMRVDQHHMKNIEQAANNDKFRYINEFKSWVISIDPSLIQFNPNSSMQMQQLLFAPFEKHSPTENLSDDEEAERKTSNVSLKGQTFFPKERTFTIPNPDTNKNEYITIKGLGIPCTQYTISGMPSVDSKALKDLSGDVSSQKFGTAYEFYKSMGSEEEGKALCYALNSLIKYKSIETLINTYIIRLKRSIKRDQSQRTGIEALIIIMIFHCNSWLTTTLVYTIL
jgi:hypothetical protein